MSEWGKGTVAGPCQVTDNAEGMTHNEMRPLHPPPGMETTERMDCSGQDCGDKNFRDTPPRPSQVATSVLSAAEMEKKKKIGEGKNKNKSKKLFQLPFLPALKTGLWAEASWECRGRERGGASGWGLRGSLVKTALGYWGLPAVG